MPISKIVTIHVGTYIHGFLHYGMLLIICSFYTIFTRGSYHMHIYTIRTDLHYDICACENVQYCSRVTWRYTRVHV